MLDWTHHHRLRSAARHFFHPSPDPVREEYGPGVAESPLMRSPAVVLGIVLAGLASDVIWAQSPPSARPLLQAVRATRPPVIDGVVTDDEWEGAPVAGGFVQYEPRRGEPASVRTEARLLVDPTHLFVAFRCWDDQPLTARLTQRDSNLLSDDSVVVLLDTANDRQTAYYFYTNPLGTQMDGRVTDDGRQTDNTWDGPWRSAAQRTEYGWSAEFAIPFTALKYAAGSGREWGINFGREQRRSLEFSSWSGPLDAIARVSQAGAVTGLDLAPPTRRHQFVPYALAGLQEGASADWQGGIDGRFGLTPEMAVYGTLNPDFATVEADVEQVNLTRFEVSLPEKRQFFLEGNELFAQRIRTFYSRRIADIRGGGKLLGRQGPWTAAFITAQTDPVDGEASANYTVGRIQRDVFGRSAIAINFDNRRFDDRDQGSVSVDTNLFFSKFVGMTAQVVQSWGPFGAGAEAFFVRPSYDSPTGHFHVRYSHLGERLRDNLNVIGRIPDDDRRELDSAVSKTWHLRKGAFEQIEYSSNYNIYWSQRGTLRNWQIDESVDVQFRNRWSATAGLTEQFIRFEKDFRNRQIELGIGYNTREYNSVRLDVEFGRNYDADFHLWSIGARRKLTSQLSAEYTLERLRQTPDPDRDSTWIHVLRVNQYFTKDLFVRGFYQINSAIERRNIQAAFVWRYLPPFGTVQVVYQRGTAAFGERSGQGNTLFLKATTVF